MLRTHTCGALREGDIDQQATLCGWVDSIRDHGGVLFIDLRDYSGITQLVIHPEDAAHAFEIGESVRNEFVLSVDGAVRARPEGTVNTTIPTGGIEIGVDKISILSKSDPLPFGLSDDIATDESTRLRFRPVDLRRARLQRNLRTRARVFAAIRESMADQGFVDVETPTLIRSTPEGARDYIVPSRQSVGAWYALPQSPQLFKQLLMVGGLDRYYQIARCWRDEDLRADRQPEFTQLDVEASFAQGDDVRGWIEEAMVAAFTAAGRGDEVQAPFMTMTWQEAMDLYGSDKPDLRAGPPIVDVTSVFGRTEFRAFAATIESGGAVRGWCMRGGGDRGRSQMDRLVERAKELGAKGLVWLVVEPDGSLRSPVARFLSDDEVGALKKSLGAEPGDLILLAADEPRLCSQVLGHLRLELAAPAGHSPEATLAPLWVLDFPLFESSATGEPTPAHHPFTSPILEDLDKLETAPLEVRSAAYDLVINGVELGSGSERIHDAVLQERIFETMGMASDEIHARFGFLLDAFKYGVPPHAGFAVGLDRLAMIILDEPSIRETIAFPKTQTGADLLTGAPAPIDPRQLVDVGIAQIPEA